MIATTAAASSAAALTRALLAYAPSPALYGGLRRRPVRLTCSTNARSRVRLDAEADANGWLFGVLFDHMIRADRAWAAPMLLADRLGHLDVGRIARMPESELGRFVRGRPGEPALHRLWPRLTRNLRATSAVLVRSYGSNAENVWLDGLTIAELKSRLHALPGMGQKLVSMTVALLVNDFGRRFRGWHDADVAVDRHVARVFLRTGLVPGSVGQTRYHVGEIRDDVVRSARRLLPSYPAALDFPAFEVGRWFCRADTPDCSRCPLSTVCPRERRHWRLAER